MKIRNIALLLLTVLLLTGLGEATAKKVKTRTVIHTTTSSNTKGGATSTRSRDITTGHDITSVTNNTIWTVEVINAPESRVSINGPAEIVDNMEVGINYGSMTLNYTPADGVSHVKYPTIRVYTPEIRNLTVYGAGDINADKVESTAVQIFLQGTGDIRIDRIEATSVRVMIQGGGDIDITSAHATNLSALLQGAGDIKINDAKVTSLDCNLQGAGDITVTGIDATSVRAICSGAGDITLRGKSTTATYVMNGAGTINASGLKSSRSVRSNNGPGDITRVDCKSSFGETLPEFN